MSQSSMMNEMIINPTRDKGEPEIPATGLLCVNPSEAAMAVAIARAMQARPQKLYNSNLLVINRDESGKGGYFVAGPSVGAPMAVLTLEKLIALGAQKIMVLGWCGAIDQEVHKEDTILPLQGISGDGTSRYYQLAEKACTSPVIRENFKALCSRENWPCREGVVWTTDAPYRESRAQVALLQDQGVLGVDMEFAALLQVATFRKVDLAAILLVSDELWREKWQPAFNGKTFKKKSKRLVTALIEMGIAP